MAERSEAGAKLPLPIALLGLALFFGAMKFDGFKPIGARAVATLLPVGVAWGGVSKFSDAHPALRGAAQVLGLAVIVTCELPVLRVLFGVTAPIDGVTLCWVLAALGALSVLIEGIAARRSLRARVSAWLGIALGCAAYLASAESAPVERELGLVFVAAVIGLWGGGLAGLVLGELVARIVQRPAPSAKP